MHVRSCKIMLSSVQGFPGIKRTVLPNFDAGQNQSDNMLRSKVLLVGCGSWRTEKRPQLNSQSSQILASCSLALPPFHEVCHIYIYRNCLYACIYYIYL